MGTKELFNTFYNSQNLIKADIKYTKKNRKLLNNVDLGNMYEKIYNTVAPLLYEQKLFDDTTINKILKLKTVDPHSKDILTPSEHDYFLRGYVSKSPDLDWFFDFHHDDYQGSTRDHQIPMHALIVIDSHEKSDAFNSWTARDYDHLATAKDFLTFLSRMQKLLNKFNPKIKQLKTHYQALINNNDPKDTEQVGVGYNATLD